jgi:hypothetical protein
MSTLLNCWEGVRKGGGGGGGGGDLHYSLDITSFLKDLTQKLSILFSQIRTMTCPDIVKSFFANPEKDISITNTLSNLFFLQIPSKYMFSTYTLSNLFFCKSRTKTCPLQAHCQIFFCKSRKKTCPLQTHCQTFFLQFTNKDMFSTNTLSNHFFCKSRT